MMDVLRMINIMDKVHTQNLMGQCIKVCGKMENIMEKDIKSGQTDQFMMVISKMVSDMVRVIGKQQIFQATMDNGMMTKWME